MEGSLYLASETVRRITAIMEDLSLIRVRAGSLGTHLDQYPQEQRLKETQAVIEALDRLQGETIQLSELFEQKGQALDCGSVIGAITDIRRTAKMIETKISSRVLASALDPRWDIVRLLVQIRDLRKKVRSFAGQSADCILETMPIPLSEVVAERITYEQIRLNPQSAIQHAFSLFEDRLRTRTGAEARVYGQQLINDAFGGSGCLTYGEMEQEREGVRNLMAGAYAVLRNPRMHRILEDSETSAVVTVALVDLMIQMMDEAEERDSEEVQE